MLSQGSLRFHHSALEYHTFLDSVQYNASHLATFRAANSPHIKKIAAYVEFFEAI